MDSSGGETDSVTPTGWGGQRVQQAPWFVSCWIIYICFRTRVYLDPELTVLEYHETLRKYLESRKSNGPSNSFSIRIPTVYYTQRKGNCTSFQHLETIWNVTFSSFPPIIPKPFLALSLVTLEPWKGCPRLQASPGRVYIFVHAHSLCKWSVAAGKRTAVRRFPPQIGHIGNIHSNLHAGKEGTRYWQKKDSLYLRSGKRNGRPRARFLILKWRWSRKQCSDGKYFSPFIST